MNKILAVFCALLLTLGYAFSQEEGVLFSAGFEKDVDGFATMDRDAKLTRTTDPELVYKGKGSLQLTFLQRPLKTEPGHEDLAGTIMFPIKDPQPALRGISFAVAASHSTPLVIMLMKGDNGPRYQAIIWCEAGEWHPSTLSLDQFQWSDDSPVDPDGKLVPEKITGCVLLDMGGMLRTMTEQQTMFYVAPPEDQSIWLDEF